MADVFHAEFRELSPEEKQLVGDIKAKALELYKLYELISDAQSRSKAIAKHDLENSVMWAVKGVTA